MQTSLSGVGRMDKRQDETRIESVIVLARDLLQTWSECVNSGKTEELRKSVDEKAETLLQYLMANFDDAVSRADIQRIFTTTDDRLSKEHLAQLHDGAIPVTVMREVLNGTKVIFNPRNVPSWRTFVERYGQYILSA